MPKSIKRLDGQIEHSLNWTVVYPSHKKLKVTHALNGDKFFVNLIDNSCSYKFWDIVGIPCCHAVVAL